MLISVCIPHYNRSRYLLAVLDSIRVQDHPEVEVIISDDCSTDDSAEVIPKYLASVEGSTQVRFKYMRQPKNLGYDGNLGFKNLRLLFGTEMKYHTPYKADGYSPVIGQFFYQNAQLNKPHGYGAWSV